MLPPVPHGILSNVKMIGETLRKQPHLASLGIVRPEMKGVGSMSASVGQEKRSHEAYLLSEKL